MSIDCKNAGRWVALTGFLIALIMTTIGIFGLDSYDYNIQEGPPADYALAEVEIEIPNGDERLQGGLMKFQIPEGSMRVFNDFPDAAGNWGFTDITPDGEVIYWDNKTTIGPIKGPGELNGTRQVLLGLGGGGLLVSTLAWGGACIYKQSHRKDGEKSWLHQCGCYFFVLIICLSMMIGFGTAMPESSVAIVFTAITWVMIVGGFGSMFILNNGGFLNANECCGGDQTAETEALLAEPSKPKRRLASLENILNSIHYKAVQA